MERLNPKTTAVIVVDVQERLAAAMPAVHSTTLMRAARILIEAARLLGAPDFTEQYPKGLGSTLPELAELLEGPGAERFEKLDSAPYDVPRFADEASRGRRAPSSSGWRATCACFKRCAISSRAGVSVYVPIDGVSSRRDDHRETGILLCEQAGATARPPRAVVFDWLRRAGSDEFKQLSQLIR